MITNYFRHFFASTILFLISLVASGQQVSSDTTIYVIGAVEEKPLFQGQADSAMFRFIAQNIRMPMSVREFVGKTGTAYIYFVIDEKGLLDTSSIKLLSFLPGPTKKEPTPKRTANEKLLKPHEYDCVIESKRVIILLKNWKPAKVGGKNVKCSMTLPVTFKNEGVINR